MSSRRSAIVAFRTALSRVGIDTVFGVPGTQNLELFEALRRSEVKTVLPTTETAASFMANGYFRASGRPAAIATIPGPGFLNAVIGLAEARHDSAAVIHLVPAPEAHTGKKFQLQYLDLRDIVAPIVKGWLATSRVSGIEDTIAEAYVMAMSGEPGPVVVEIDHEVLKSAPEASSPGRSLDFAAVPDSSSVDDAVAMISSVRRVVIFAGQGVSEASPLLAKLAEILRAPVVATCSGRGVIPEDHHLSFDLDMGAGGVGLINELFEESDVVLAIGCKFSHNGTSGFELAIDERKLIHVDASRQTLSSGNYKASLSICSDAGAFLEQALKRGEKLASGRRGFSDTELAKWKSRITKARDEYFKMEPVTAEGGVPVSRVINALMESVSGGAIVVTDSGMHQTLTRNAVRIRRPRGLVAPSDFQSTGYGLPAAIGAKIACPDSSVMAVIGDGSLASTALEMSTARSEGLDLMVVLINDGKLGSIRLQQLLRFGREHAVSTNACDCRRVAEACGAEYFNLGADIRESIEPFVSGTGVRLLEVRTVDSPEVSSMVSRSLLREKVLDSPIGDAARKARDRLRGRTKRS